MNTFLRIFVLITANLMLVASSPFQNRSIFSKDDITNNIVPPPLSYEGLFVPGTKWCGLGPTTAENFNDLGEFNRTDACCRSHTECQEKMKPFSCLHDLCNKSAIPKYDCKCEQKFRTCLKLVNDIPSMITGQIYFSVMNKCFANDFPAVDCITYQEGKLGKRCTMYKFDVLQKKQWQFFDLPFYTGA